MKTTQLLIATQKEMPSDATTISHKLMIRAGMIAKLTSGLYSYLPIGLKVIQKVKKIVREEMNKSGAQELLMPVMQPAELWKDSGRWEHYGAELIRFKDRHQRDFCLGPTHEEVITNIASQYLRSYKQLPVNFYQIQTKFRDEIRPRFGVMRAREFIMKDAYSFHLNKQSLKATYELMYTTYCNIFERLGLNYRVVLADSGTIGGDTSHEFHVLADSGEDVICFSDSSSYAANIEHASTIVENRVYHDKKELHIVATPNQKTINKISEFLKISPSKSVKTLIVRAKTGGLIALVLRGDHQLNEAKASKINAIATPLQMVDSNEIKECLGVAIGSIGVVGLSIPLIVDHAAACLSAFVCGANEDDKHFIGVDWDRDVGVITTADLRNVVTGDKSPDGKGRLIIKQGIEIGHIFQLGTKYTKAMNCNIVTENNKAIQMMMGCYGIGITRVVAAAIEQWHDDRGIIFNPAIAPFQLIIVPINYNKSMRVKALADDLYQQFLASDVEVLLDNRKERAGVMFADAELLGIPHRIVISDTHVHNGSVEYKARHNNAKIIVNQADIVAFIKAKIEAN